MGDVVAAVCLAMLIGGSTALVGIWVWGALIAPMVAGWGGRR